MAQRDKTQGFGFVYVDAKKLIEQVRESERAPEISPTGVPAVNFNKDPRPVEPPPGPEARQRTAAINQIRQNLDRLQSLHHKLHAILEDLNKISDPKKKTP